MIFFSKKTFHCLIGSLLAVASFHTNVTGQESEENFVRAEFSVYSIQRLTGLKILNGDRASSTSVDFFSSARSDRYEYFGPNPIIFFRETPEPTPDAPDNVRRIKVAEISLPTSGGEFLFLFFNVGDQNTEQYRILALDDSTRAHPFGAIRLLNLSPFDLNGVIGRDRFELARGASDTFRVSGNSLAVGFGFFHEGTFLQSYKSPLRCASSERVLMLVYPPHVKGSSILQTRFLRESEPEDAEPVAPTQTSDEAPQ